MTNSLRDGLTNGDTLSDLKKRLHRLPTDLERFFKVMLNLVDPLYHVKIARCLQIAINARQPLDFLLYCMHEYEYEDQDYALKEAVCSLSHASNDTMREQCQRRLNARRGGLLELKNGKVEFLHRTVRDFLLTREMSDYLTAKNGSNFCVHLSTFSTFVALLRCQPAFSCQSDEQEFLGTGLQYATDALDESLRPTIAFLGVFNDLYTSEGPDPETDMLSWELDLESEDMFSKCINFRSNAPNSMLRTSLLRAGVDKYVSIKLQECPNYFGDDVEPPLSSVMRVST